MFGVVLAWMKKVMVSIVVSVSIHVGGEDEGLGDLIWQVHSRTVNEYGLGYLFIVGIEFTYSEGTSS